MSIVVDITPAGNMTRTSNQKYPLIALRLQLVRDQSSEVTSPVNRICQRGRSKIANHFYQLKIPHSYTRYCINYIQKFVLLL